MRWSSVFQLLTPFPVEECLVKRVSLVQDDWAECQSEPSRREPGSPAAAFRLS